MAVQQLLGMGLIMMFNYMFLYRNPKTKMISILIMLFIGITSFIWTDIGEYISVLLVLIALVLFMIEVINK